MNDADQTQALARAVEALSARVDRLTADLGFASETPAIAALLQRKAAIEADLAAGGERLAAISQAEAALQQREIALDQRERQIKIREFQFGQKVDEATGQLRASYLSLTQADRAMRVRLLHHAGWLDGFDPGIREIPSWDAISKILGMTDAIPEMQDRPTELVRADWNGDEFVAGSTLTRQVAMSEHDDLPTPKPPPPVNKRPRRSSYRAAYRRALGAP